jgi:hypothetical protein
MIQRDTLIRRNGWIRHNGQFLPCDQHGHKKICRELNLTEEEAERQGWIKIAWDGNGLEVRVHPTSEPTQDQFDTLWDWCLIHQEKFGLNAKETFERFKKSLLYR